MSSEEPMVQVRDAQLYKTSEIWRLERWFATDNLDAFRFVIEGPKEVMEPIVRQYEEGKLKLYANRTDKLTFTPVS